MPIHDGFRYLCTEIREVIVTARSAKDAQAIATAAFKNGQNSANGVIDGPAGVWGNTEEQIRVTSQKVERVK